jgi:nucleoside-diphosphate-sugar epimerase
MYMNIVVTGATGKVGSRLVPRLLQRGDAVRVLVREPERARELQKLGADVACGNLAEPGSLKSAVHRADAVIHLAAFFRGATPEQAQAVNLDGTRALAEAAMEAGVRRFVFASTNLVYGPGDGRAFREDDPVRPAAPYPQTKAAAEQALMELHRSHGLGLRVVRLAFVYGEGDPHLQEGLQWFRRWNPEQRMLLLHHADASQALMLAADADGSDGRIYNAADDGPVAAGGIMKLYGESAEEGAAERALDPAWLQLVDTGKIKRELGFAPIYPTLHIAAAADAL